MGQGSSGFGEDEWDEYERGMPLDNDERASTSRLSPDFQKTAPDTTVADAATSARASSVVVDRLPEVEAPVLLHRRARNPRAEARIQQRDQQAEAESVRQQERARTAQAREIQGSDPYQDDTGAFKVRRVSATGDIHELDAASIARTDASGNKVLKNSLGQDMVVGVDEDAKQRAELLAKRRQLTFEQRVEDAGRAELRAQIGPAREALAIFGKTPEELTAEVTRRKAGLNPAAPDPMAAKSLALAEQRLADWHKTNPDYLPQKQKLDALEGDLNAAAERKRAREWAILSTMGNPDAVRRVAAVPREVDGAEAPPLAAPDPLASPIRKLAKPFFTLEDAASGIWDALSGLGTTAPAAFYQLTEGLVRPDQYSPAAKEAFKKAAARSEAMQKKTAGKLAEGKSSSVGESLREAGDSLGFSAGTLAAAIPAGMVGAKVGGAIGAAAGAPAAGVGAAPGAATGALIGGAAATLAASGAAAYRMAGASFLNESFATIEAESQRKNGRPLNEQEKASAYAALLPIAKNTALWEAGPEAVGNAVTLGAGKIVFGLGKPLAAKFAKTVVGKATAAAGAVATELGTETLTQVEQSADQRKAQALAEGRDPNAERADWSARGVYEAFKEVAPQTLALLGLMGGAGGIAKGAVKLAGNWKQPAESPEALANLHTQLEDAQASARTARDEVAAAKASGDAARVVEAEARATAHERQAETLSGRMAQASQSVVQGLPIGQRQALAKQADAEADFEDNERRLASEPVLHFASATIGAALATDGTRMGTDVGQFIADQHAGMKAVRELGQLAQGKAIDGPRAAVLESLGLVEAEDNVPGAAPVYRVTDDAVALLPEGLRRAIAAKPGNFNVVVTPGATGDLLSNLSKSGQRRVLGFKRAGGRSEGSGVTDSVTDSGGENAPLRHQGTKGDGKQVFRVKVSHSTPLGEATVTERNISAGSAKEAEARERAWMKGRGQTVTAVEIVEGEEEKRSGGDEETAASEVPSGLSEENAKLAGALKAKGVTITRDSRVRSGAAYEADEAAGFADGDLRYNFNPREDGEGARAVLVEREELLHVADLMVERRAWMKSGRRMTFEAWVRERSRKVLDELVTEWAALPAGPEREAIGQAMVASWNVYRSAFDKEAPVKTVGDLVARLRGEELVQVSYVRELVRQLAQLRRDGVMAEQSLDGFIKSALAWIRRALAELKALAATLDAGALKTTGLAQAVRDVEAELDALLSSHDTNRTNPEVGGGAQGAAVESAPPEGAGERGAEAAGAVADAAGTAERGAATPELKPGEQAWAVTFTDAKGTVSEPVRIVATGRDDLRAKAEAAAPTGQSVAGVTPWPVVEPAKKESNGGKPVGYVSEREQTNPEDQPQTSAVAVQSDQRVPAGKRAVSGVATGAGGSVAAGVQPGDAEPGAGAEGVEGLAKTPGELTAALWRSRIGVEAVPADELVREHSLSDYLLPEDAALAGAMTVEDALDNGLLEVDGEGVLQVVPSDEDHAAMQAELEAMGEEAKRDQGLVPLLEAILAKGGLLSESKASEAAKAEEGKTFSWGEELKRVQDALKSWNARRPEGVKGIFPAKLFHPGGKSPDDLAHNHFGGIFPDGYALLSALEAELGQGKKTWVDAEAGGDESWTEAGQRHLHTRREVHEEVERRLGVPVPADLDARLSGMTREEAKAALLRYGKAVEDFGATLFARREEAELGGLWDIAQSGDHQDTKDTKGDEAGKALSAEEVKKWSKVYRRLWELQQEGKTLNAGQRALFEQAERMLGQRVLFGEAEENDELRMTSDKGSSFAEWKHAKLAGTTDFGGDFFDEKPGAVGKFTPGEKQGALFARRGDNTGFFDFGVTDQQGELGLAKGGMRPSTRGQFGLDFGERGLELFDRGATVAPAPALAQEPEPSPRSADVSGLDEGAPAAPASPSPSTDLPLGDMSAPAPVEDEPAAGDADSRPAPAATPAAKGIEDFGEKIGGARKDLWQSYQKAMGEELPADGADITLSKSFPEPDYEVAIANGVPVESLAAFKAMRDLIPAKPRNSWKLQRWTGLVRGLHGLMQQLVTGKLVVTPERIRELAEKTGSWKVAGRVRLYQALGYPAFTRASEWEIEHWNMLSGPGASMEKPLPVWQATYKGRSQPEMRVNGPAGGPEADVAQARLVDLIRAKIAAEAAAPKTPDAKRIQFNLYQDRFTKEIFIGKKALFGVVRLKSGLKDAKEGRQYLADHQAELEAQWEGMKVVPDYRRPLNAPRQGPQRRDGDVSPELFAQTFGFRGVQFGNWVEGDRRQVDLNSAFDAFMDLAAVFGVPPKAMSLDGSLGLAFGARGTGGTKAASAHYEQDLVVINLTKKEGPGSLAHEWFHALDNYFARLDKTGETKAVPLDRWATDALPALGGMRAEVAAAFKGIFKAVNTGSFAERSKKLDQTRSKPYYSLTIEKAARAFERYLVDRLEGKEIANDYLVNVAKLDNAKALVEGEEFPLPTDEEMAGGITQAFDQLFNTLDTKETPGGVALYARRDTGTGELFGERDVLSDFADGLGRVKNRADSLQMEPAKSVAELVRENVGLAVDIAGQYRNIRAEIGDIVGEAKRALVKAARAFDPERGNFAAFAATVIRRELNEMHGREKRYAATVETTLDEEIAGAGSKVQGLETAKDRLAAPGAGPLGIEQGETTAELAAVLGRLPERPRAVLRGLAAGRSLEAIGVELGLPKWQVARIAENGRKAVGAMLRARGLRGVDGDGVLYTRRAEGQGSGMSEEPKDFDVLAWHGTPEAGFSDFKDAEGGLFFTDKEAVAQDYTNRRGLWLSAGKTPKVFRVKLRLGRALEIDAMGRRHDNIPFPGVEWKPKVFGNLPKNAVSVAAAARRAFAQGYDSLVVRNVIDSVHPEDRTQSTVYAVKRAADVRLADGEAPGTLRARVEEGLPPRHQGTKEGVATGAALDDLGGGDGSALESDDVTEEWVPIDVPQERGRKGIVSRAVRMVSTLFESAADVLERQKNKSAQKLAKALYIFTDLAQRIAGGLAGPMEKALASIGSRSGRKGIKRAKGEFATYTEALNESGPAAARAVMQGLSRDGQELVKAWRSLAAASGAFAQKQNVQVWDTKLNDGKGGYRLIGNLGEDYWPRVLKEDWRKVLEDPDKYADLKSDFESALRAEGFSEAQIAEVFHVDAPSLLQRSDFFGQLEMARQVSLPASFYETGFDRVAPGFIAGYADRLAQIGAFGQKLKHKPESKDLFDEAMEEAQNEGSRDYIQAIQKQVYRIGERTAWNRFAASARTLASGLLLANPFGTVPRNIISGVMSNIEMFGTMRTLRGLAEIARGAITQMTAKQLGTVKANFMEAVDYSDRELDAGSWIRRFSNFTLKISGYQASERWVRTLATASAMTYVTDYLAAQPGSAVAVEAEAFMRRMKVDPEKVRAESGDFAKGQETRRAVRSFVNESQFSYGASQVPVWENTPSGRLFVQYGRWSSQRSRQLWRHVFQPAIFGEELVDAAGKRYRVRRMKPLATMLMATTLRGVTVTGGAVLTGEIFAAVAQLLFKRDRDDEDWDVIREQLSARDEKAMAHLLERLGNDVMIGGMVGILSQPIDMVKSWVGGARFKNPLEPPASAVPKAIVEVLRSWYERGMPHDMEDAVAGGGKDLWMAMRSLLPGVGQGTDTIKNLAAPLAEEAGWIKSAEAKRAVMNLRKASQRFAREHGMEGGGGFDGRFAKRPQTASYDRIQDALLIGDIAEAQRAIAAYEMRFANGPDYKQNKKAMTALRLSMNARQPVKVGSSRTEEVKKDFMEWASDHVSPERFAEFLEVQRNYEDTARALGLM